MEVSRGEFEELLACAEKNEPTIIGGENGLSFTNRSCTHQKAVEHKNDIMCGQWCPFFQATRNRQDIVDTTILTIWCDLSGKPGGVKLATVTIKKEAEREGE